LVGYLSSSQEYFIIEFTSLFEHAKTQQLQEPITKPAQEDKIYTKYSKQ
jgi:hypothetical protein